MVLGVARCEQAEKMEGGREEEKEKGKGKKTHMISRTYLLLGEDIWSIFSNILKNDIEPPTLSSY